MDKETLSNYGWIVVCILVLSIMIALATPFGEYIGNAVKSTANGLFETQDGALKTVLADMGFNIFDDTGEDGEETHISTPTHVYYRIGSGETLSITFDTPYNQFKRVKINDVKLTLNTDYTVSNNNGNAMVTFKESYLRKMVEGDFMVMLVAQDGYALAELTTTYTNSLDVDKMTLGYISAEGLINTTVTTLSYTGTIPVEEGDTFAFYHFASGLTPSSARFVAAYDANGNVVASAGSNSCSTYTVPKGIASIVVTMNNGSINEMMIIKNTQNKPTRYISFNGDEAGSISLDNFINVLDKNNLTTGYITTDGVVSSSVTTLKYTKRIPVKTGDTFTLWCFTSMGGFQNSIRFITAYNDKGEPIAEFGAETAKTYTVPAGVASVAFTISAESAEQSIIVKNNNTTPPCYIPYNYNGEILDIPLGVGFINLYNKDAIRDGFYMGPNGGVSGASSLCYSSTIAVEPGDKLYFWNNSVAYKPRFITAFDADGKAVTESGVNQASTNEYIVPDGIYGVIVTIYNTANNSFMVFKNKSQTPPVYIPYVQPEAPKPEFVNVFNKAAIKSGYMGTNGGVSSASSLFYSEKIYVTPGDTIYVYSKPTSAYAPRFITAFDINGNAISGSGTSSPSTTYVVPEGIYSIVITAYTSVLDSFMVFINNTKTPTTYIEYVDGNNVDNTPEKEEEVIEFNDKWLYVKDQTMGTSTKISLGKADIITDKTIYFSADVTSFSGLRIGHGYKDYTANYIEINETGIKQYFYTSSATVQKEVEHGLTITGNIEVKIEVNYRRVATITVTSNGKSFTFNTSTSWYGSNGEIYAESMNSVMTNVDLGFTCDGYDYAIHFYGDSYLSQSSDRWLYYAFNNGYTKALFDGYGGRTSAGGYTSLVENLKHSNPEIVVWLLGMNDGSDTDINTPSTAWATNRDKLIALSHEYGFEIVFVTIPTVPNINHEAKNKWIRESGYRYIDVAEALNADGSGAWTDGMLSTDKVHPTALGAEAIYKKIAADFKEFKEKLK